MVHDPSAVACWKHSLPLIESNRIILETCMSYLLLSTFEHDLEQAGHKQKKGIDERDELAFLRYSAKNWAIHFRNAAMQKESQLLPLAREICKPESQRLQAWLKTCWEKEDFKAGFSLKSKP